jgi:hypothetical protein
MQMIAKVASRIRDDGRVHGLSLRQDNNDLGKLCSNPRMENYAQ